MDFGSWETWVQDVAKGYINTKTQAQYQAPVELEKMKLQAFAQNGMPYVEGQTNMPANIGGLNVTTALLIGGGLLALVLVLK